MALLLVMYTSSLVIPDKSPLLLKARSGYICAAYNLISIVHLPHDCNQEVVVKTAEHLPNIRANEIRLTPVIDVTPYGMMFSLEKPAIIELMKTITLSNRNKAQKLILLCRNSSSSRWKEVEFSSDCEMLDDRIVLRTTHFGLFTVIARFKLPSATVTVEQCSQDLIISELPGFKLKLPSGSAPDGTEISATVYYNDFVLDDKHFNQAMASPCIELKPHGQKFNKEIPITLPLPNYEEIMEQRPDAKIQIWHDPEDYSEDTNGDIHRKWEIIDKQCDISQEEDGMYVATFHMQDFCTVALVASDSNQSEKMLSTISDAGSKQFFMNNVASIESRCQAFMSRETKRKASVKYSIAVFVYPFCDQRYQSKDMQHHPFMLYDSGKKPVGFLAGELNCKVKVDEDLHPQKESNFSIVFLGDKVKREDIFIKLNMEVNPGEALGKLIIEQDSTHGLRTQNCSLIRESVKLINNPGPVCFIK